MNFLAPLGLLLGALAVPLISMYFLKIRRKKVKVPSVMLWTEFAKNEKLATPFQRFRRNLLLLLQLLILALLTLAFARPFLNTDQSQLRSLVLVVDTTASMGATDLSPNRLGEAVSLADETLDGLSSGDEVMLVVVGPRTEVRVPFTRDRSVVRSELNALEVSQSEGSLKEGLQLALSLSRSRPGVEIAVLSDGSHEDLVDLQVRDATIAYSPIGRDSTNVSILALDLRSSPVSELERQVFVTVQNFGVRPVEGTVEVYLDDQLVGLRTEELPPGKPAPVVFDLPGKAKGILRAEVHSDGDLLLADNKAVSVVASVTKRKVLLVGGDSLTARVLQADPRVELTRMASVSATSEALEEADATLFATAVPAGMDGRSYAVLGPLAGSPVRFGGVQSRPRAVGWRRTHPALRFVSWDGVLITEAKVVQDTAGLSPIVEGDIGPLVMAGERSGGRVVALAFDPLASDLPLRVAWPVFVLNTVGWLTESGTASKAPPVLATGTPFVRRVSDDVTTADVKVIGPDGGVIPAQVAESLLRVQNTTQVGVYEVRIGSERASFAANLHSVRESNIKPVGDLKVTGVGGSVVEASVAGRQELWRWLVGFGLLFLIIEWVVWNQRRLG